MNFEYPTLLLLMIPVAAAGIHQYRRFLPNRSLFRLLLLIGSLACLIIAVANPAWRTMPGQTISKEADTIVILDVSQSMFCKEDGVSRIEQAQSLMKALLPTLTGSSISVVYFAGDAQIGSPFTLDAGAVRLFLDSVSPGMSGVPGTNAGPLGELLAQIMSEDHTMEESRRKKIGLLFSDGEFKDGTKALGSWLESNRNFTLFTFACGKNRSAVPRLNLSSPYPGAFSRPRVKDLQDLAESGHGKLFRFSDSPSTVPVVNELTSDIREIVSEGEAVPQYESYPFALASLLLLLAYQAYPLFVLVQKKPNIRLAAAAACVCLFTLAMAADEKHAVFTNALQAIKQKQYEKAILKLQKLKEEGDSEEVEIALGNAYYYQNRYDEAIRHYEQALGRNPGSDTARWNWEVALKQKSRPGPPPQTPPQPQAMPPDLPRESQALLKYSDQLEREQLKELNSQNATNKATFDW